ncbi:hypothetical protein [Brachyspira hampsonii]|uniref:Uncharacterized protein n=1 Tax=Brachyspira hampsonii TaxID=1287055 RepID=A0AAC9TSQ0_9SPIR|nr:hypothetical protein [Brachyspira hampsonii]ASJ21136.1 hypothetical protein BHAMNSH16_05525 [Brachyspira hampsonii]ELV06848.1 hypothetical protein H263_01865 [Brachyspira hampsonii 30599]MBW5380386.1 hypothetical protein [Brachyspira hampsonii]MBW5409832.1 hypothetical protein [Brachyspira hampsonii]OEJ16777.1 hypothetical protein A9496_00415 [Brachyspira hampsonii]
MKTLSIISVIFIVLIASCTKDYGVKVTKPGADLILSKMQSGNWAGVKADGNTLTISGSSGNLNGSYNFEEPVLGIGGIYKDSKGEYIMAAPAGSELYVVKMTEDAKKAVDTILDVLDDEGGEAVVGNLISAIIDKGADKIDLSNSDEILKGTNLPADKKAEIENILKNSNGGFTAGEAIK